MARYEEKRRTVEIISFDEMVEFGKKQGAKLTEVGTRIEVGCVISQAGLPMAFTYMWRPVRLQRDDLFIVVTEKGHLQLHKGHSLVVGRDCEVYTVRDEKVLEHFVPVTEIPA